MRETTVELQRRLAAWWIATRTTMRNDDRGAMTVETAILTALLAAVAIAFVGFIAIRVNDWQNVTPQANNPAPANKP